MRRLLRATVLLFIAWVLLSVGVGLWFLPALLLRAPMPHRTEAQRTAVRQQIGTPWRMHSVLGGQGLPVEVWRLHRPQPQGVVVYLHGFGDDAWGTLGRAADLPEWDAVSFTFRGRDRHPGVPCTLGAWERRDVVAVVRWLEGSGVPRGRIVLAAWSMGAGTALLALSDLEQTGGPLGGALLECPFQNMAEAARNHIRGPLGPLEPATRLAQRIALARAGHIAGFQSAEVDPACVSPSLRTPRAYVTGDADSITPLEGVRSIAQASGDLTVVAGAGHCEASNRLPGGWKAWANTRLARWIPPT